MRWMLIGIGMILVAVAANPFTDVAPTSQDRFKVRLRSKPNQDLSIVSTFWYRKRAVFHPRAGQQFHRYRGKTLFYREYLCGDL